MACKLSDGTTGAVGATMKEGTKCVLVILGGVGLVLAGGAGGYLYWSRLPKPQTGYNGVQFGDDREVIKYKLGLPSKVLNSAPGTDLGAEFVPIFWVNQAPSGSANQVIPAEKIADYDGWQYDLNGDGFLTVRFGRQGSRVIDIECSSQKLGVCPKVFGLDMRNSESVVRKNMGTPSSEHLEYGNKYMLYDKLHVQLTLSEQRINTIHVGMLRGPAPGHFR